MFVAIISWQNSPSDNNNLSELLDVDGKYQIFWLLEDTTYNTHKSFSQLGQFLQLSNGKSLSIRGQIFVLCLLLLLDVV